MPTSLWSEISWRGLARHATQSGEPLAGASDREAERVAIFSPSSPIPASTDPGASPRRHTGAVPGVRRPLAAHTAAGHLNKPHGTLPATRGSLTAA